VVQGAAGPLQPEVAEEAVAGLWAAAAVVACGLHPVPRTTGRLGQGCRDDETAAVSISAWPMKLSLASLPPPLR
jgi:hypothetical protein